LESDLVIQLTDMVIIRTAPAIIHMDTTDRIHTTVTILGGHTTTDTVTIATTVIITIIRTKLT
jgi:hypothetical protein